MPKTIYYWKGVLAPETIIEQYKSTFDCLYSGQYKDVCLEKLKGSAVYSIRALGKGHKKTRLLFTTLKKDGKQYLVLLDVVLNHNYHKSKFLKSGHLKSYLQANENRLKRTITADDFSETKGGELKLSIQKINEEQAAKNRYICKAAVSYNHNFIVFNDSQNKAVQTTLPVLITGAPGTGKSSVGLEIIDRLLRTIRNGGNLLFVCKSPKLAEQLKKNWQCNGQKADKDKGVEFKSYAELYADFNEEKRNPVSENYCEKWLKKYLQVKYKQQKNIKKSQKNTKSRHTLSKDFFNNPGCLYQEFRIISGFQGNKQSYLESGKRLSFYKKNSVERQRAWQIYQTYQLHLEEEKLYDRDFSEINTQKQYDGIVVDEAQDFSRKQLLILAKLARNNQLAYCCDSLQSLTDCRSTYGFLKKLTKHNIISLPTTYRCAPNITKFANAVLLVKRKITKGIKDKAETREIQTAKNHCDSDGIVQWEKGPNPSNRILELAKSPSLAVICSEKHKEEAAKMIGTKLCFTADEIKGLEYDKIVLYKPFNKLVEDKRYQKTIKKVLKNVALRQMSDNPNRKKNSSQETEFLEPWFGSLYVGCTRAEHELYVVQPPVHGLESLLDYLSDFVDKIQQKNNNSAPEPVNLSHTINEKDLKKQWQQEFNRLVDNKKLTQAKQVFITKLGGDAETFTKNYLTKQVKEPEVDKKPTKGITNNVPAKKTKLSRNKALNSKRVANRKKDNKNTKTTVVTANLPKNNHRNTGGLFKRIVPSWQSAATKLLENENLSNPQALELIKTLLTEQIFQKEILLGPTTVNTGGENRRKSYGFLLVDLLLNSDKFYKLLLNSLKCKSSTSFDSVVKMFVDSLRMDKFLIVNKEKSCTLFDLICCHKKLMTFFSYLLKNSQKLRITLQNKHLFASHKPGDPPIVTILEYTKNNVGINFLRNLLHLNDGLKKSITAEQLFRVNKHNSVVFAMLASSEKGVNLLKDIASSNKYKLYQGITKEHLGTEIRTFCGNITTVGKFLCENSDSSKLLCEILIRNKSLVNKIIASKQTENLLNLKSIRKNVSSKLIDQLFGAEVKTSHQAGSATATATSNANAVDSLVSHGLFTKKTKEGIISLSKAREDLLSKAKEDSSNGGEDLSNTIDGLFTNIEFLKSLNEMSEVLKIFKNS